MSAMTNGATNGPGWVQAIRDLVEESTSKPAELSGFYGLYAVTHRHDQTTKLLDLERNLYNPRRAQGTVVVSDAPSFAAYYSDLKTRTTRVYADRNQSTITAVFNDDQGAGKPDDQGDDPGAEAGWRDHRCVLRLEHTDEWKAWAALSGKLCSQGAFAEFIEDHVLDIREPDGATMLELAQSFEASIKAEFVQGTALDNGARRLVYKENIEAKAGRSGNIDIPRRLVLGLAPYDGVEPFEVGALLRYRISDGALGIGVVLERPDLVLKAAFVDVLTAVEAATGATILHGRPAEPR